MAEIAEQREDQSKFSVANFDSVPKFESRPPPTLARPPFVQPLTNYTSNYRTLSIRFLRIKLKNIHNQD